MPGLCFKHLKKNEFFCINENLQIYSHISEFCFKGIHFLVKITESLVQPQFSTMFVM